MKKARFRGGQEERSSESSVVSQRDCSAHLQVGKHPPEVRRLAQSEALRLSGTQANSFILRREPSTAEVRWVGADIRKKTQSFVLRQPTLNRLRGTRRFLLTTPCATLAWGRVSRRAQRAATRRAAPRRKGRGVSR